MSPRPKARKARGIPKVYEHKTPCNSPTALSSIRPAPHRRRKLTKPTHAMLTVGTQTDLTTHLDAHKAQDRQATATRPPSRPSKPSRPKQRSQLRQERKARKKNSGLKKRIGVKQRRLCKQLRQAEALRASNQIIAWAQRKRVARERAEELRRRRNEGVVSKSVSRLRSDSKVSESKQMETGATELREATTLRPEKPASARAASRQREWAFRRIYRVDDHMIECSEQVGNREKELDEPVMMTSLGHMYTEAPVPKTDVKVAKRKRRKVTKKSGRKPVPRKRSGSASGKKPKVVLAGMENTIEPTESVSEKLLAMDLFEDDEEERGNLWECTSCRFANESHETCCALCGEAFKETASKESTAEAPEKSAAEAAASDSEYSVDDFV